MMYRHFGSRIVPTTDGPILTVSASEVERRRKAHEANDARRKTDLADCLDMLEARAGLLGSDEIDRLNAVIKKCSGATTRTTAAGVSSAADADDAARHAADDFHREVAHNRKVAKIYADFWKEKSLASLQRYGSRR